MIFIRCFFLFSQDMPVTELSISSELQTYPGELLPTTMWIAGSSDILHGGYYEPSDKYHFIDCPDYDWVGNAKIYIFLNKGEYLYVNEPGDEWGRGREDYLISADGEIFIADTFCEDVMISTTQGYPFVPTLEDTKNIPQYVKDMIVK